MINYLGSYYMIGSVCYHHRLYIYLYVDTRIDLEFR